MCTNRLFKLSLTVRIYIEKFWMKGTFSVNRHLVPLFIIENKPPNTGENTIRVKILNDKNQTRTNALIRISI